MRPADRPPRTPEPIDFGEEDLAAILELNRLRSAGSSARRSELEARFAAAYGAERRLAVYGSLAPGRENEHQLHALRGEWVSGGFVRGGLVGRGWGAGLGYPALRWSPAGERVSVVLFVSDDLPAHWDRLDAFEGDEYLRLVVPVHGDAGVLSVANLYAAR